jgi:hypothetical protein
MIKKIFTIPRLIILVLLIVVSIMLLWLGLRSIIVKGMTDNIALLEEQGFEIGHGGLSVTGFPFTIDARTHDVSLRAPTSSTTGAMNNWSIKSDSIDLYAATLKPLTWLARHRGDMRVDMRGIDGERYMIDISPAKFDADLMIKLTGGLKKLHTNLGHARFTSVVGAVPPVLEIDGLRADLDVKGTDGYIDVLCKNIALSDKAVGLAGNILGQKITRVAVQAQIEQLEMLQLQGPEIWMGSAAHIKSDYWAVEWGAADIIGEFDIGFKNGKPEGVIRLNVKNANSLLNKLVENGLVPLTTSTQIGAFIARIDKDVDGRQSVELTIRDGVLKYGFFTLYEF